MFNVNKLNDFYLTVSFYHVTYACRVNLHSVIIWMSMPECPGAIPKNEVTRTGLQLTTTYFVNEHSTIHPTSPVWLNSCAFVYKISGWCAWVLLRLLYDWRIRLTGLWSTANTIVRIKSTFINQTNKYQNTSELTESHLQQRFWIHPIFPT